MTRQVTGFTYSTSETLPEVPEKFGGPFHDIRFSSVAQPNSATSGTAAHQASLSITNSWSLLKLISIESVMPCNHLILCHPLLLCPWNSSGKNTGVVYHSLVQGLNLGIKPTSPALAGRFFTTEPPGKPFTQFNHSFYY